MLPLAAYTLDRVVAERHLEFVLVDALGCPTEYNIARACARESRSEVAIVELGGVAELHLLLVVGDGRIDLLEIGCELLNEALARLVDGLRVLIELLLEYLEEFDRQ